MEHNLVGARVIEVAQKILGHEVGLGTMRENLDSWDSLVHVDLIFSLEDEFDVAFPLESLVSLKCLQDFVEAIERIRGG